MNFFLLGAGAAAVVDHERKQAIEQQAAAAEQWHAQTGQMTDAGYNAIVMRNHQRRQMRPGDKLGLLLLMWFLIIPAVLFGLLWLVPSP